MNESDNSIDNSTVEDETQESKDETKEFCNDPAYCITHCDGPCCRTYGVLVTPKDVRRILDNIPPLDVTKFIAFYQGVDDRQDAYPKVLLKGEEYQLGILDSDLTGGCMFQTNLGICGIHTFTPMVCQTYPWVLDSNDDLVGADNILCNHQFPTGSPEETRAAIKKFWGRKPRCKKSYRRMERAIWE